MSFSKIAPIYDRFNDLTVYENWLDFTLDYLDGPGMKVLDVGCGTGYFTQMLAPFSETITGVDLDAQMLKQAQAAYSIPNLEFKQANMLDLSSLSNDYQLVTCFADTLCFLKNIEEVELALKQIYQRMTSDSILLFDVWTPYQIKEGFHDFNYFDLDDLAVLTWQSRSYPDQLMAEHYLTALSKIEESGLYERVDTQLVERTYPMEKYQKALRKAGFNDIEVTVDFGNDLFNAKVHQTVDRWFFAAYKQ
ncbi:class I SAM-dependent DNA methyltransferase [Fundicoccus culcitae]|uniref:Methyltransferase domain-containing protein n=1 Tax=Fundicoccus culcitae TaxID=2969821 RepID=A0ABY5P633_9LACT|nr:class I SAM-dependent methyltransferase [Fundicoccus culcitae]UUX34202.1 methyltransferase domain-containing protein [Fundicoccus culcitae]